MIVPLGKRRATDDVVDLLLECHHRIRNFVSMARDLASASADGVEEIRTTAARIRRYFAESLPMHVADEEEQVVPRLTGWNAEVDRALATMTAEHEVHEPFVARLVAICAELAADPRQITALGGELAQIAARLERELAQHLELEERVIFPALRQLTVTQREEILAAVRERRARALDVTAQAVRAD